MSNLPFSLTGDRMMTSTWQRSYFASVETGKKVVLCDWRLALLYHTLNLLILLLMFFNLRCRHTQHPLRIGTFRVWHREPMDKSQTFASYV